MGLTFKIPVSENQLKERNKNSQLEEKFAKIESDIGLESTTRLADDSAIVELLEKHKNDENCHGGILHKNWIVAKEIEIPKSDWSNQFEPNGFNYTVDIELAEAKATAVPNVSFEVGSLMVAQAAEVCGSCLALDGFVRFWAKQIPESNLLAVVKLAFPGGTPDLTMNVQTGTAVAPSTLPTASKFTLGGVKVQAGSGLQIDADGNLSISPATLAEILSLLKE